MIPKRIATATEKLETLEAPESPWSWEPIQTQARGTPKPIRAAATHGDREGQATGE